MDTRLRAIRFRAWKSFDGWKLFIKKGVITQEEFLQKIAEERAIYQAFSIHQHTEA